MNIWEWLTVFGFTATILGAFLTVYGMINNKILKAESQATRELLEKMEDGHLKLLGKIDTTISKMDTTISKMDTTLNKMDTTLGKIEDTQKYIADLTERVAEGQKYIAQLIVAEGERTREAIGA